MTTPNRPPLSPAAQAVLDAITAVSSAPADEIAAAALHALADHQTPAWDGGPLCHWTPTPHTRQELRNIAEELECGQVIPVKPQFPLPRRVPADLL